MKPKTITIENFRQFKPSEFIESVIEDIQRVREAGFELNMNTYYSQYPGMHNNNNECQVCLGGISLLGFLKEPIKPLSDYPVLALSKFELASIVFRSDAYNEDAGKIAFLFDRIRAGDSFVLEEKIKQIWPGIIVSLARWNSESYNNTLTEQEIDSMILSIKRLVRILKAQRA